MKDTQPKPMMNGKYLPKESWEKQDKFLLDNGCKVTVEWSHYGEMVCRIDFPDGTYWHCSEGIPAPDWAEAWREVVVQSAGTAIIRPRFKKVWD